MDVPLLGPDDPPPFALHNPAGGAPVLIVCDHAGRALPRALGRLGLDDWVLDRHVAWDIGSASVARGLAERLDAPAVLAGYSRLVVDLNRRLDDPSAFARVSDGIAIPANLELGPDERDRRARAIFEPYHAAIRSRLDAFQQRGIAPALIAVHSCTPVFDSVVRPWHVGVLWDRDARLAAPLLERLRARRGVEVGDNEPYSGRHSYDFTVDHHGEARGLPCVGIEVRQDLIDTDAGAREWAGVLADALGDILADPELYRVRPGLSPAAGS